MTSLKSDLLVIAAAVSAGIHAALIPEHLREDVAAGAGFIAATALLTVLIVGLTYRPRSVVAVSAAAFAFTGLLLGYALAVTSGLPLLHPNAESVDGLALVTKAVEAIGLVVALDLIRSARAERLPFSLNRPEGVRA
jgi:hypothetical protein